MGAGLCRVLTLTAAYSVASYAANYCEGQCR